jgi:peptidoglycan/LPS O-acetylase OafA/YrhL
MDAVVLHAIGALILVTGIAGCRKAQVLLELKPFKILGDYSFSAILIHMPVMSAVSCLQYLIMTEKGISSSVVILSVFLAAIPVQILAAFLFQKMTVPLTNIIVKAIGGKVG